MTPGAPQRENCGFGSFRRHIFWPQHGKGETAVTYLATVIASYVELCN